MSKPLRLHYIRHVCFEGPANIASWAKLRGHTIRGTHLDQSESFPDLDSFDWLVIMGGPMSVNQEEEYSWLVPEKQFVLQAIDSGKTVLGICLGAQLIANVLGGVVYPGPHKEIGWFPIELTTQGLRYQLFPPEREQFMAFHWHGETFTTPSGACILASSNACAHQVFMYEQRVLGLQCHLESTPASVQALLENCQDELLPGPYTQSPTEIQGNPNYFNQLQQTLFYVLDCMTQIS